MRVTNAALAVVLLAGGLYVPAAHAAPILSIQLRQAGFDPLVIEGTDGFANYTGAYGTFSTNVTTGIGRGTVPASFGIDLNSVNIKTSGRGVLNLFVTETGLRTSDITKYFNGSIGGTFDGTVDSVSYSAFADGRNKAFGKQQQIGSTDTFTGSPFSGTLSGFATDLNGLYSITEQVTIDTTRGGSLVSFDAQLSPGMSPVPLPASAPMFGAALLALAGFGYGMNRWVAPKGKTAAAV